MAALDGSVAPMTSRCFRTAFRFENLNDDRAEYESTNSPKTDALVDGIERFACRGSCGCASGQRSEVRPSRSAVDRARQIALGRVGLDNREGAFIAMISSLRSAEGSCGA